ncbi:MAG: hypothetical protein M3Z37_09180, partial [Candidatus Eremiobacteraeota bacterium]|nr:hypothetical protein [Candidatus Eremiobacteraeota bacterium]
MSADAHINRIQIDNPSPSAPVNLRGPRTEKLHGQALDREQRAKKYQRLKSLSQRAANDPGAFAALAACELEAERRREALQALRPSGNQAVLLAALERRRMQYVSIPHDPYAIAAAQTQRAARRQSVTTAAVQAVCTTLLAMLVLPVLVAVLAQFGPSAQLIVALRSAHMPARPSRAAIAHRPLRTTKHRASEHPQRPLPATRRAAIASTTMVRRGPWALNADGRWTTTVHAPRSMHDVQFRSSAGEALPLERSARLGEGAIVRLSTPQDVTLTIASSERTIRRRLAAPLTGSAAFGASAQPMGPHLVSIGWTALPRASQVAGFKIFRSTGEGEANELIASVAANERSFRDMSVDAGSRYRYIVAADSPHASLHAGTDIVATPLELPAADTSALAGKGMFLYFS